MPNFKCPPSRPAGDYEVTVYHAMPHGLRDGLRRRIIPEGFVDTTHEHATKREALAAHKSQQEWLDLSQRLNSYLLAMEDMSLEMGRMSKRFKHAEGWRRHLHLGFVLTKQTRSQKSSARIILQIELYERSLEKGY